MKSIWNANPRLLLHLLTLQAPGQAVMQTSASRDRLRFEDFELDLGAYEVRRKGHRLRLGKQPMDVLMLLVESRGQLVSRGDIAERLWGKDVFVDVETRVNTAISKVRQALRDSADAPAFVETVPGKGYRFIADVELMFDSTQPALMPGPAESPAVERSQAEPTVISAYTPATRARFALGLLAVVIVAALFAGKWLVVGAPVSRITLAVLPFESLGNDLERQYLADGFTDETAASLAQIDPKRLRVKGRTLRYRGTTKTAAEIDQELSVDYLVESSIRAEGAKVRVTTTLIRVRDQEHVWSQSYERRPSSLLTLQQEVSTAITEQIRLRISPNRLTEPGLRQTQNADAYDAYLKGHYLEHRRTPETNARAIEQYGRAVGLDPNYALAWSSMAFTYAAATVNSDARPLEMAPRAHEAAAHALRANSHLTETQFAMGYINWLLDWNWKAAEG